VPSRAVTPSTSTRKMIIRIRKTVGRVMGRAWEG
jgi:hypothetical protein